MKIISDAISAKRNTTSPGEEIIGSWMDDRPFIGRKVELLRKAADSYSLRFTYKDGSGNTESVDIEETPLGKKVFTEPGKKRGEYFIILKNGNLQHWDSEGLYHTLKKLG